MSRKKTPALYDQLGKDYSPEQDFRTRPNWDSGFEFTGAGPGDAELTAIFSMPCRGAQARSRRDVGGDSHPGTREDHHARCCSIWTHR